MIVTFFLKLNVVFLGFKMNYNEVKTKVTPKSSFAQIIHRFSYTNCLLQNQN